MSAMSDDSRQFLAAGRMQGDTKTMTVSATALFPLHDLTESDELRLADAYSLLASGLGDPLPGWKVTVIDRDGESLMSDEHTSELFLASVADEEGLTLETTPATRHLRAA